MAAIGKRKDGSTKSLLEREIASAKHVELTLSRLPKESRDRVMDMVNRSLAYAENDKVDLDSVDPRQLPIPTDSDVEV